MQWSIIIPVYQALPYLGQCLECIRQQMDGNTDVWLIDDASTDGCAQVCEMWSRSDSRFHTVRHSANRGLSAARNTGLDHAVKAGADWILFVDADDWLAPDTLPALRRMVQTEALAEADVVEFPVHVDHGSQQAWWYVPGHGETVRFQTWVSTGGWRRSYAWNKVFRAALWPPSVRFEEGRLFEDMFAIPYVMERARFICRTDCGGYYYCRHAGSLSDRPTLKGTTDLLEATLRFYHYLCGKGFPDADALDEIYLEACNRQIACLEQGGAMLLPPRRVKVSHVWRYGQSPVRRLKWLLMSTGRTVWCRWWARWMPFWRTFLRRKYHDL